MDETERDNCVELDKLIGKLEKGIEDNDVYLEKVRFPNLLLDTLNELKNMIGMNRVKKSISHQVVKLIRNLNSEKKQSNMLHTILYGPPGVGKTQIGIILAKIWYSIGYLKTNNSKTMMPEMANPYSGNNDISTWVIVLFYFFLFLVIIFDSKSSIYIMGIIIFVIIILLLVYYFNGKKSIDSYNISGQLKDDKIKDRDIITVVSRKDFIAGYVGQSALKTTKLLDENRGKVLFIDEAYSLLNDLQDPFGNEVLTTLNLYMSEHADEIGIIFAGYRDKLEHGVFEAQPGLPRRFMWHFDCDPYNANQLSQIFFNQITKQNYIISSSDKVKISKLIKDNICLFPSYGGDTERLLYFSSLGMTSDDIDTIDLINNDDTNQEYITYEEVVNGLQRLRENNIKSSANKKCSKKDSHSTFEQLFNNYSKQTCNTDTSYDSQPEINIVDEKSDIKETINEINKTNTLVMH